MTGLENSCLAERNLTFHDGSCLQLNRREQTLNPANKWGSRILLNRKAQRLNLVKRYGINWTDWHRLSDKREPISLHLEGMHG